MTTPSAVIFSISAVFYVLTWVYIRQLVRDVNLDATAPRVSLWRWNKGWGRHRTQFPGSPVRKRIVECIALAVALGLIAFVIEVRRMFIRF